MRRPIAILVGLALVSGSAHLTALHFHAYTDHDHPEHHHGLAAHEHHGNAHPEDGTPRLESCDAARHSVSIVPGCAALVLIHGIDAGCASRSILEPPIRLRTAIEVRDIRVHGPPGRTQSPPRAPPLIVPA